MGSKALCELVMDNKDDCAPAVWVVDVGVSFAVSCSRSSKCLKYE